jgi:hypothetical protein
MNQGFGSSNRDKATADRDAALDNQHRLVQAQAAASGTSSEMSTYHRVREAGRQVRSSDARVRQLEAEGTVPEETPTPRPTTNAAARDLNGPASS